MKRLQHVDVVIVGSGWTGLAMAREITARTSLSVVVLERGPTRKFADFGRMKTSSDTTGASSN